MYHCNKCQAIIINSMILSQCKFLLIALLANDYKQKLVKHRALCVEGFKEGNIMTVWSG